MSDVPPGGIPYAAYPRAQASLDLNKLRELAKAYFNLNWVFLANILLALAINVVAALLGAAAGGSGEEASLVAWLVGIPILFFAVMFMSYPQNKRIAYGKGWAPSAAWIASFLMGLNSALCCGIIGFIVMQSIASKEMAQVYGVRRGFFGPRKADIERRILELSVQPPASPPPGYQA